MKSSRLNSFTSRHTLIVAGILFFSLILRATLIVRGGQFYFSDESRYQISRDVAGFLLHGKIGMALADLVASPEHLGFKIIGVLPAAFETMFGASLSLPALFFSLFSVLNLYLIYKLSQRSGASPNQSILALLFAASSHALLYYSRHLLPYDTALFFGLLALYVGSNEEPTINTSLACGVLGCLCFVTYNGYWTLAGFAMLVHIFVRNNWDGIFWRKAILTALGFILPVLLLFILAHAFGINLFSEYRKFASSIRQGDFVEGWSLPFEYLWSAEHLNILIFGGLSLFSISRLFKNRDQNHQWIWAAGLLFVYVSLVIFSVLLHKFVVYGRLARQMMPFIILLAASGLSSMTERTSSAGRISWLVIALIMLQAAWNFAASYNVSYPREFAARIQAQYPDFEFSEKRLAFGAPTACRYNRYILENAKYFLTPPDSTPPENGTVLLSVFHPVNFRPYQYEGYPAAQRKKFRQLNLKMSFYEVNDEFRSEANPAWISIKSCVVKDN